MPFPALAGSVVRRSLDSIKRVPLKTGVANVSSDSFRENLSSLHQDARRSHFANDVFVSSSKEFQQQPSSSYHESQEVTEAKKR
jgi:hypothetical protein